MSFIWGP